MAKRGPYRLSEGERQRRRDAMNRQRAAGKMKPVSRMNKQELTAYIERSMEGLPSDVRDRVIRETTRPLMATSGEAHGGAEADSHAPTGDSEQTSMAEQGEEPVGPSHSASHSTPHSRPLANPQPRTAAPVPPVDEEPTPDWVLKLVRNVQREQARQRELMAEQREPDLTFDDTEQGAANRAAGLRLHPQAPVPAAGSDSGHATYSALQRQRRSLL